MRNYSHKYETNNWLKIHKKPMRRKPFKREVFYYDENERNQQADDQYWDGLIEDIRRYETTQKELRKQQPLWKRLKEYVLSQDDLKCGL